MYRFTQMNYLPQRQLYKIGLLTVACAMVGLSGCYRCPATGIVYAGGYISAKPQCENACKPPVSYTFPNFDRDTPSKEIKLHVFVDGNGLGAVKHTTDNESSECKNSDCGVIEGKISCKSDSKCTRTVTKDSTVDLSPKANDLSSFVGWGGDKDCQDGQLTMDGDKYCIAVFNIAKPTHCTEEMHDPDDFR